MADSNESIVNFLIEFLKRPANDIPEDLLILYLLVRTKCTIYAHDFKRRGLTEDKCLQDMFDKIESRMKLGKERYGHGVRVEDDTRKWGTLENSWMEMCEEEVLDGIIYAVADQLRRSKQEESQ